jgi:Zn-dependent M28 family amino/carboxypeptidase
MKLRHLAAFCWIAVALIQAVDARAEEPSPVGVAVHAVSAERLHQSILALPSEEWLAVEAWISSELAAAVPRAARQDLSALERAAATPEFRPVPLGLDASLAIRNTMRSFGSRNVMATLTGSDPRLRDGHVLYTAHWDHLGIGVERNGDRIYNGAVDSASGTAASLEIASAFRNPPVPPRRTLLFLALTAEERGLLGSRYYAEHPLYPLARTAAVINMDGMTVLGRTWDVLGVGGGASSLDEVVSEALQEQARVLRPDPEPEKGFFYRSDHFEFAKRGVPAFYPDSGVEYLGKPEGWGLQMRDRYTAEDYHKPSDEVRPEWDLSGAAEDTQLYILVGWKVANAPEMPRWKPGAEFKSARDESLRAAGAEASPR